MSDASRRPRRLRRTTAVTIPEPYQTLEETTGEWRAAIAAKREEDSRE